MTAGGLPVSSQARIAALPCWHGTLRMEPLKGGISNESWKVADGNGTYVVRFGDDNPHHGILRWHEKSVSSAAADLGISPAVHHEGEGVLVLRFIEGRALAEEDVREPAHSAAIAALLRRVHEGMLAAVRGPMLAFHPYQVNADYLARLRRDGQGEPAILARLEAANAALHAMMPVTPFSFAHNDLLPANFIDDGHRLWLIDWEYSGLNSVFFDLGGAASNAAMDAAETDALLAAYFGRDPAPADRRAIAVAQAQSLLRETVWSMTSERHSTLDFDFAAYTEKNLHRFEAAFAALKES
jgi:thiamine kinase-like enzyme